MVVASGNSPAEAIGLGPAHTHIPAEALARSVAGNSVAGNSAVGNSVADNSEVDNSEERSSEAGQGNRVVAEVAMQVLADILGQLAYYWVRLDSLPGTLEDSG